MYQFATAVLVGAALSLGLSIGPESAPAAPSAVMAELLATPVALSPTGWCAQCETCQGDKWEAPAGTHELGWSTQACDWGDTCHVGCLFEEEDTQALSPEEMKEVSDRVLSGDPLAARAVLAKFPGKVRLNHSRASVQFDGCGGELAANLPLTAEQFSAALVP